MSVERYNELFIVDRLLKSGVAFEDARRQAQSIARTQS